MFPCWTDIPNQISQVASNHHHQSLSRTKSNTKSKTSSIPRLCASAYFTSSNGRANYPVSDNSWEPASHLSNAKDLVHSFHSRYPDKPSAPLPPPSPASRKRRGRSKRKVNFVGSTVILYS